MTMWSALRYPSQKSSAREFHTDMANPEKATLPVRRRLGLLITSACLVPAVLGGLQQYVQGRISGYGSQWQQVVFQAAEWLFLGALTPIVYILGKRFPVSPDRWKLAVLVHVGGALLLCFGWASLGILLGTVFNIFPAGGPLRDSFPRWLLISLPYSVFMYFTELGCIYAVAYFVEARTREAQASRLATQLAEARIGALRMQLNPHFLFNSLNALAVLVREKRTEDAPPVGKESDGPSAPVSEGGIGQVLDAPLPDEETPGIEEQAREWSIAVNQAVMLAKQAGKVPAGIGRTLEGAAEAAVDWREMLRRLWSETTPADYSWMRPNRRHIWAGLYLPGVIREGVGEIAIAVDCSGSVNGRQLRLFEAEVRSILEGQRPQRVYVLYFDATVQKVETYEAGQRVALNPVGGGGTEFGPCFDWLDEHGVVPQTLVFLTDLWGTFPTSAPSYPVLWASTGRRQAPFGEVIPLHTA
jgi:hypothetical protein